MSVILHTPLAATDLLDIWMFIARDSPRAATRVLRKIDEACATLSLFPGAGAERDDLAPGLRSFPVYRYLIFSRRRAEGIEVIRVLHGARNIDARYFNS